MTKLDWTILDNKMSAAGDQADQIIKRLDLELPIQPQLIIDSEEPFLKARGGNFGSAYDGKLRYNNVKKRFLLFYNTKYDVTSREGENHPKTRFSICHELGHYFIDQHHSYLINGGLSHSSKAEFVSDIVMEREADTFASRLMIPTDFLRPRINQGELKRGVIMNVSRDFRASVTCSALRCVKASFFPSALVCIREGTIAWFFANEALIKGGCYPAKGRLRSEKAISEWALFLAKEERESKFDMRVKHWFSTYDREELDDLFVTETYFQIPSMNSLLVMLTMDENDLYPE